MLNAEYQRRWLDSLQPEDPSKPKANSTGTASPSLAGDRTRFIFTAARPRLQLEIGYDPANNMTLIVWTNLTVSLDDQLTANTLMLKVLDQIYMVSPLSPSPSPTN